MARPLRVQFPGSLWHVSARGNERRDIVRDDADRDLLIELLGEAVDRFDWIVLQYVLMTNHYHLVLELTRETLSSGMKWLNGTYAQKFNRRYARAGHLFQGRFDARLIEKETYLQQVLRYVVLNPVRAGMVSRPEEYRWSGHCAMAGLCPAPPWLAVRNALLSFAPDEDIARIYYTHFVDEGMGLERSPWRDVIGQIYLGSEAWIERVRTEIHAAPRSDDHPLRQKEPLTFTMADVIAAAACALPANEREIRFGRGGVSRMATAWLGWHEGGQDLRSIAAALRVRSSGGISKLIRTCDAQRRTNAELQAALERCARALRAV